MARLLKLEILARRSSIQSAQRSVLRLDSLFLPFDKVETSFKKKQGLRISILGSKKRASFLRAVFNLLVQTFAARDTGYLPAAG